MIDPGELFLYGYYREMKKRNLVAKNSKHKSGAGTHKSKKDYDRKVGKEELLDLLRQQQEAARGISEWTRLEVLTGIRGRIWRTTGSVGQRQN